jgi:hypothetical protein
VTGFLEHSHPGELVHRPLPEAAKLAILDDHRRGVQPANIVRNLKKDHGTDDNIGCTSFTPSFGIFISLLGYDPRVLLVTIADVVGLVAHEKPGQYHSKDETSVQAWISQQLAVPDAESACAVSVLIQSAMST